MWYTIKHYVYLLIINIASMITRIMSFICKYNYRQKKKEKKIMVTMFEFHIHWWTYQVPSQVKMIKPNWLASYIDIKNDFLIFYIFHSLNTLLITTGK